MGFFVEHRYCRHTVPRAGYGSRYHTTILLGDHRNVVAPNNVRQDLHHVRHGPLILSKRRINLPRNEEPTKALRTASHQVMVLSFGKFTHQVNVRN